MEKLSYAVYEGNIIFYRYIPSMKYAIGSDSQNRPFMNKSISLTHQCLFSFQYIDYINAYSDYGRDPYPNLSRK